MGIIVVTDYLQSEAQNPKVVRNDELHQRPREIPREGERGGQKITDDTNMFTDN